MSTEVTVTMTCGCRVVWPATAKEPPACGEHGVTRVQSVNAPAPRFVVREN